MFLGLSVGAFGLLFGLWQMRQAKTLRDQMVAFHGALIETEECLRQAEDERDKWKNAAEGARANVLREVENLMNYNGTGAGQHGFDEN